MGFYQRIASLLPSRVVESFKKELSYLGINIESKRFVGFLFISSLGAAAAVAVNAYLFFNIPMLATFTLTFAMLAGGTYFWFDQMAEGTGKKVERALPDVLELIASNVKAGLTTERAIFAAARPEFGAIAEELKAASKKILSGRRMDTTLMEVPQKIKSQVLERTIWLLVEGIKSGGQIADLLIQLASDLREENAMKDEIKANISMYVMLIFFAAAFGAPLLFGISSVIVGILTEQTEALPITAEQMEEYSGMSPVGRFFGVPTVAITEEFTAFFALIALIITSVFAGFTIGAISAGSEKEGVKYIPVLLLISLALFYATRIFLGDILGNITNFF